MNVISAMLLLALLAAWATAAIVFVILIILGVLVVLAALLPALLLLLAGLLAGFRLVLVTGTMLALITILVICHCEFPLEVAPATLQRAVKHFVPSRQPIRGSPFKLCVLQTTSIGERPTQRF